MFCKKSLDKPHHAKKTCLKAYRHIRNYYLCNSKTFQDGNGNGNFEEINSNDFLDGNRESMENEGATAGAKTVTVMVIHPNFKTVTVTVIFGKQILKSNKTAGNNFDSNGKVHLK